MSWMHICRLEDFISLYVPSSPCKLMSPVEKNCPQEKLDATFLPSFRIFIVFLRRKEFDLVPCPEAFWCSLKKSFYFSLSAFRCLKSFHAVTPVVSSIKSFCFTALKYASHFFTPLKAKFSYSQFWFHFGLLYSRLSVPRFDRIWFVHATFFLLVFFVYLLNKTKIISRNTFILYLSKNCKHETTNANNRSQIEIKVSKKEKWNSPFKDKNMICKIEQVRLSENIPALQEIWLQLQENPEKPQFLIFFRTNKYIQNMYTLSFKEQF